MPLLVDYWRRRRFNAVLLLVGVLLNVGIGIAALFGGAWGSALFSLSAASILALVGLGCVVIDAQSERDLRTSRERLVRAEQILLARTRPPDESGF